MKRLWMVIFLVGVLGGLVKPVSAAIILPYETVAPTIGVSRGSPTPTAVAACGVDGDCGWCGNVCKVGGGGNCPDVLPPEGQECKCVAGSCRGVTASPTPTVATRCSEYYVGVRSFAYTLVDGTQKLRQAYIPGGGVEEKYRTCSINTNGNVIPGTCDGWTSTSLNRLRGAGAEIYLASDTYVFTKANGQKMMRKTYLDIDGRTFWSQTCGFRTSDGSPDSSTCGAWSSTTISGWPGMASGQRFRGIGINEMPTAPGDPWHYVLNQFFIADDYKSVWMRRCPHDDNGVAIEAQCQQGANYPFPGNGAWPFAEISDISIFSYQGSSQINAKYSAIEKGGVLSAFHDSSVEGWTNVAIDNLTGSCTVSPTPTIVIGPSVVPEPTGTSGCEEKYIGQSSFTFDINQNGSVFHKVRQAVISGDGKTEWYRQCNYNENGNVVPGSCDKNVDGSVWFAKDLTRLRGLGGESYLDSSSSLYDKKSGGQVLFESYVDNTGKIIWQRYCDFDGRGVGIGCGAWDKWDMGAGTLRGVSEFGFVINEGGVNKYLARESLIYSSGVKSEYMDCPVDASGRMSDCNTWSAPIPIDNMRGVGNEKYTASNSYIYKRGSNGTPYLRQSFIDISGKTSWFRDCPFRADGQPDTANCLNKGTSSEWVEVDLSNLRGSCTKPTVTVAPPTGGACGKCPAGVPTKQNGNADCDAKVGIIDFGIWKAEFIKYGQGTAGNWNSDFNCNGKPDIIDFGIWLANYLKGGVGPTPTLTPSISPPPFVSPVLTSGAPRPSIDPVITSEPKPLITPVVTAGAADCKVSTDCGWCGSACQRTAGLKCPLAIEPSPGRSCGCVKGQCGVINGINEQ